MRSVNTTFYSRVKVLGLVWCFGISLAQAQTENSPYSRYGLGDIVPSQNILNRGMGGIAAAYYDLNSVNFINPASYSRLQATTLDIGVELDNRTLRGVNPPRKFQSYSPMISYVQLGFPLKKNGGWGLNLGLRPLTRINYKIERNDQKIGSLQDTMSINNLFEGNGGAYEAHIGTGFVLFKDLSIGINAGYLFGSKDFGTRVSIYNNEDSILYLRSNHHTKANYGGILLNAGIQYRLALNKTNWLRFGAYGNLRREFNARKDVRRETFDYNGTTGAPDSIDVVSLDKDISGEVIYPTSYGVGLIYDRLGKWLIGVDYSAQQWSKYRFFNEADSVRDDWTFRLGAQLLPSGGKNYWSNVSYRAGFSVGQDYIYTNNKALSNWSVSLGASLPMRKAAYTNQFSVINTTLEFGQRGNKQNIVRESYFRIAVGLSLSDIWFMKRKYD